jgi:hypothetical protein
MKDSARTQNIAYYIGCHGINQGVLGIGSLPLRVLFVWQSYNSAKSALFIFFEPSFFDYFIFHRLGGI